MSTSLIQVQMNVMNLQSSIQSLVGELGMRQQLSTEQKNQLVMSIILIWIKCHSRSNISSSPFRVTLGQAIDS